MPDTTMRVPATDTYLRLAMKDPTCIGSYEYRVFGEYRDILAHMQLPQATVSLITTLFRE